ncbi:SHOCT domain-containing protein [Halalkalicoccus sp. NIPERK01]|uniref:SHOCT domain-containing protein n=1 Tax=Halalkalicoccus sp. NIPERK01 TaxID=3053469 RepID=UPI00256F1149|nr:SHOCT domain-containing protein [Halalkalicoccus sp. NIPERK01]MDL5361515.1 SHOCT domain-containing protein [Halalkalicoccus sp. NIPERK01]
MGWLSKRALVISLLVLLVSSSLLAVVLGYVGLVVYSAMTTGTPVVGVLLGMAIPYLPIVAALLVLAVLSGCWFAWSLLRRVSVPRSDRLASAARRAELRVPPIGTLGLSESLSPPEPTPEERAERALAELKRQYVDGEIDEREFERRVDRLVSNASLDEAQAARERRTVLNDGERDRIRGE